jgi:RNA polymerase primary sigma factor
MKTAAANQGAIKLRKQVKAKTKKRAATMLPEDSQFAKHDDENSRHSFVDRQDDLADLFEMDSNDEKTMSDTADNGKSTPKKGLIARTTDSYGSQLDPVKVYLQEMGAVSLLSSKEETKIAKKIEAGEKIIQASLFASPLTLKHLRDIADKILAGKRSVSDVLRGLDENDTSAFEKTKERFLWQVTEADRSNQETCALRL